VPGYESERHQCSRGFSPIGGWTLFLNADWRYLQRKTPVFPGDVRHHRTG